MEGIMKKLFILVLSLLFATLLSGCCLSHEWMSADCTHPQICAKCGEEQGEALGHELLYTCQQEVPCSRCQELVWVNELTEHTSQTNNCEMEDICAACGTTLRQAQEHVWNDYGCQKNQVCQVCCEESDWMGYHTLSPWVREKDGIAADCSVCKEHVTESLDRYGWYLYSSQELLGTWVAAEARATLGQATMVWQVSVEDTYLIISSDGVTGKLQGKNLSYDSIEFRNPQKNSEGQTESVVFYFKKDNSAYSTPTTVEYLPETAQLKVTYIGGFVLYTKE